MEDAVEGRDEEIKLLERTKAAAMEAFVLPKATRAKEQYALAPLVMEHGKSIAANVQCTAIVVLKAAIVKYRHLRLFPFLLHHEDDVMRLRQPRSALPQFERGTKIWQCFAT